MTTSDADTVPVVRIATGAVRGTAGAQVDTRKGIRYAQPPIRARRWRGPMPTERAGRRGRP